MIISVILLWDNHLFDAGGGWRRVAALTHY